MKKIKIDLTNWEQYKGQMVRGMCNEESVVVEGKLEDLDDDGYFIIENVHNCKHPYDCAYATDLELFPTSDKKYVISSKQFDTLREAQDRILLWNKSGTLKSGALIYEVTGKVITPVRKTEISFEESEI